MKIDLRTKLIIVLSCIVLASCQKETDENITSPQPQVYDFETFSLSVIDNTLAFESEAELNKCFTYLAKLGDENFDSFEEGINYMSYRRFFTDMKEKSRFDEELYSTLLNPEGEIIVGDYLLQDRPEEDNILVYKMDCENRNSEESLVPDIVVNRDQDVFKVIRGEAPLKSVTRDLCKDNKPGTTIYDFKVDIDIKTQFNTGIIKYFKAKISRPWCIGCGITLRVENRPMESTFCLLDKDGDGISESKRCDFYDYDESTGTSAQIYFQPGFRPTDYRYYVDYTVVQEGPYLTGTYNGDISCGPSNACY
jgi:hypothetical protein